MQQQFKETQHLSQHPMAHHARACPSFQSMKRLGFVLPTPPPGKDASPLQGYLSSASNLFVIIYPPTERRSVTRLASIFRIKNMMKNQPVGAN